jgi:type I restriction enzyme S subunit
MSFPRYPTYKDSGVEWLGEVPGHWGVEPFKHQIERNDGGVWGDDPDGINDTIVLRSTEQTSDGRWQIDDPAPRKLTEAEVNGSLLVEGDLLLTKSSGSSLHIGKTTLVTAEIAAMRCCYSNFMQRIRLRPSFLPKLAWHVMNNDLARLQFDLLSNSSTGLANLNATMIGQIVVPVPSLPEQTQIATFLDRETAKIDALVAEQRRLMDLLKEKRQAVISHAVTQGLNPDAPMKPSGVEWLGEVPEHWDSYSLKYIATTKTGYAFSSDAFVAEGIPVLRIGDITSDGCVDFSTARFLPLEYESQFPDVIVTRNDIVMAMTGATIGKVGWYKEAQPALLNQRVCIFRARTLNSQRFLWHVLNAAFYAEHIGLAAVGGAQPNISDSVLLECAVPVPPPVEQEAIAAFLDAKLAAFFTLTTEAQRAIDLLQERRTALISAAVTGQIDVRDAVAA